VVLWVELDSGATTAHAGAGGGGGAGRELGVVVMRAEERGGEEESLADWHNGVGGAVVGSGPRDGATRS
jgi:hypothetical protein